MNRAENVMGVPGLSLLRHAASQEQIAGVVRGLDTERWTGWVRGRKFSRQHFGFAYNIGSRDVEEACPIPEEIRALFPALRAAGWQGAEDPTQVIVTRYPQGGSLGIHIDSGAFGPEVAGVSLGTEEPIVFAPPGWQGSERRLPLPVLSAYVMRGPARTAWFHKIPPTHQGIRTSLTFRTVLPPDERVLDYGSGGRQSRGRQRPATGAGSTVTGAERRGGQNRAAAPRPARQRRMF